jgi:phage shock protein PspC (stress-responsive transcriptional regulator)
MSSYEHYPSPVPVQPPARTLLVRSRSDKMLGGVCGGFAEFTNLDANMIRLVLVAATVLGFGSPIIVYLAAWLLMPLGE